MRAKDDSAGSMHCIKCRAAVSNEGHFCPACGYTLEGISLYNPKHFFLLAALLSGLVPIFLAASNWNRIGDSTRGRYCLLIGFVGFMALFGLLILLPDRVNPLLNLLGYLINLYIGWMLHHTQRPVYKAALALGARSASVVIGAIKGFGLTLLALAIPIVSFTAFLTAEENRALAFYEEGQYEKAMLVYERLLLWDAEDGNVRFSIAICHIYMEQWEDAATGFRSYLKRHDGDPEAHAYLGYALQKQGQQEEAEQHFAKAERLDPEVLRRLFDFEYEVVE